MGYKEDNQDNRDNTLLVSVTKKSKTIHAAW